MMKKLLSCLAAMVTLFVLTQALAEEITVTATETKIGENAMSYPQLEGMADQAVQEKINSDIVLASNVSGMLMTLVTLDPQMQQFTMDYEVCRLDDEVFSVVISAMGRQPGKRDGHTWTALSYDLSTGERLTLDQLFEDPQEAVARMEEIAEASLSEELNGYMEYSEIVPLPQDQFTLDDTGITFWYPEEQFSLFSGFSGACQFWYEELEGLWLKDPTPEKTDAEIRIAVEQAVSSGVLPSVPVRMGQSMQEIADAYRLVRTPDEFPGGRYFVMEDPRFRQILILSDSLYSGYDRSVAEGIQLKRGGIGGLTVGETTQLRWREVLGEPEKTVAFTENMAYDYNLPAGEYDVYRFGGNELRLHADENGVLCAVQLCK